MKPQPPRHFLSSKNLRKELSKPGPSWVILTICAPWKIEPNEAPPATVTVHAPDHEVRHHRTMPAVKFHGQPQPDAPGSAGEPDGSCTVLSPDFYDFRPFSGHFGPPHRSFPPFLDPLNSFPRSLFAYSTSFGSYNENEIGRRLDRIFRPPQRLLDQGNGTNEFLVSWAFH